MKLQVSEKHIKLRIAIVAVAFVVAVAAFTIGVVSIGKKTPGYQTIEAKVDADTILANKTVVFKYWLDGSTNEIKRGIRGLEAAYTPILLTIYKELDPQKTYSGVVNLASLNQNQGQELTVSAQLYEVLRDAYRRTLEKKDFNMFAGALYGEWQSILILDDPFYFDPLITRSQADRIDEIVKAVSDLNNFKLEFLDDAKHTVRFSVSDYYRQLCCDYEIEAPALDLNVLRDAYMIRCMASSLAAAGYTEGYLATSEGLVLNMRKSSSLGYELHTLEKGNDTVYATLDVQGAFSGSTITAFGMGTPYHYVLRAGYSEGKTETDLYRNRYFNVRTGGFSDILMSLTVINPDPDIVDTACLALQLNNLTTEADVKKLAASLEKSGMIVSYILQSSYK